MHTELYGNIRTRTGVLPGDVDRVRLICESSGFFSPAEVEVAAELAGEALARGETQTGYHFVFAGRSDKPEGFACFGPDACAQGAAHLYWIAVLDRARGCGLGRALLAEIIRGTRAFGGRRLYSETSGRAQYAPTRAFYEAGGFTREAVLPDFYSPGDDKVIFRLNLTTPETSHGR